MNKKEWLDDKIVFTLSRREVFDLSGAIAQASFNDVYFTKIRDRKIRKLFADFIEKRHNLWLKLTHTAQEAKVKNAK